MTMAFQMRILIFGVAAALSLSPPARVARLSRAHYQQSVTFVLVRPRGTGTPILTLDSYHQSALIHLEFDNSCQYAPRGRLRADGDTLVVTLNGLSRVSICPGFVNREAFAAAVRGLAARHWFVRLEWADEAGVYQSDTGSVDVR
jgi:hypothetical protein